MKWISVKDRLPETNANVLAFLNGHICIMAYATIREEAKEWKEWCYVYDGIEGDPEFDDEYYPTHWMPIPAPPTEGEDARPEQDELIEFNNCFAMYQDQIPSELKIKWNDILKKLF